ncbi:feruloyl esterase B precursor [Dendryphion nanum]|uniref:Carboxylic ester hydrolase n=1 Tax=Dendryphion nanum TaxID=256645 RepID=A0A9P9DY67_9PLEO|nr:feruloyl esterase B precursor [Dendryphion nanum]
MFLKLIIPPLLLVGGALAEPQANGTSAPASVESPSVPSTGRCKNATFKHSKIPGAKILEISAEERRNSTTPGLGPLMPPVPGLYYCEVKVYLTHPGADDKVLVETWLPLETDDWNGRYQAGGGGAYATGMFDFWHGPAVQAGYAASSTDGGHERFGFSDPTWILNPDKSVNWGLVHNFATRSLADQIVVAKDIVEQYYGTKPHHSYWNGCSQGGRQGYAIAQQYPGLLDGILANSPALKFPSIAMAAMWPRIVMKEAGTLVSNCEFSWFTSKALEQCDILDGARDGVISNPLACSFDHKSLIGQKFICNDYEITVTPAIAEVVSKLYKGPSTPFGGSLYPGHEHGSDPSPLFNITIDSAGVRTEQSTLLMDLWVRHVLNVEASSLTYAEWISLWLQTAQDYAWILNADSADLTAFSDAGGKLLTWHGTTDVVVPYQNTVTYRERVNLVTGDRTNVNDFYRLFLAPGVEHCGGGPGAWPRKPMEALVDWVEKGEAPETLDAEAVDEEGDLVTRELCLWPRTMKYMGIGSAKRASSWSCEGGDDEEQGESLENQEGGFLGGLKDKLTQVALGLGLNVE